jgi:hypothetical protein
MGLGTDSPIGRKPMDEKVKKAIFKKVEKELLAKSLGSNF